MKLVESTVNSLFKEIRKEVIEIDKSILLFEFIEDNYEWMSE